MENRKISRIVDLHQRRRSDIGLSHDVFEGGETTEKSSRRSSFPTAFEMGALLDELSKVVVPG